MSDKKSKQRTFTSEFIQGAIKLVREEHRKVSHAAPECHEKQHAQFDATDDLSFGISKISNSFNRQLRVFRKATQAITVAVHFIV